MSNKQWPFKKKHFGFSCIGVVTFYHTLDYIALVQMIILCVHEAATPIHSMSYYIKTGPYFLDTRQFIKTKS